MWFFDLVFGFIYKVLDLFSSIVTALCIFAVGCAVWLRIKERKAFSDSVSDIDTFTKSNLGKYRSLLIVISLIGLLITSTAIHQLVGVHNLELKPEGTYCFYVEAQRQGSKTYVLPARVEVVKEEIDRDERSVTIRTYYYIKTVFFSNGGCLDVDDGETDPIGKPTDFWDIENDEDWELTLLNEHAYSPYVEETDNADWLDLTFLFLKITPHIFLLWLFIKKDNRILSEKE